MSNDASPERVVRLTWGVKQSFRNYVEAVGGAIATAAGAERAADGAFTFSAAPGVSLELTAGTSLIGAGAFVGEVRFEAHGGMLSVSFADPAVEISPTGGVLTVADRKVPGLRLEIVRLDVAAAQRAGAELVIPAAATLDGMQLLGDHYPPGTVLDPVRLLLEPAPPATPQA
ncbi:MAG TPA: HtaA domain-containing protein [Phenylobacterium sp.]